MKTSRFRLICVAARGRLWHSRSESRISVADVHNGIGWVMIWKLKKGSEKKFRGGHPWVFSSELERSPKGIGLGGSVELQDYQGQFLAYGYGHPNSQISFRVLSRNPELKPDRSFLLSRLQAAARLRQLAGLSGFSHRLCFAEADSLPGLIIDRYFICTSETNHQTRAQVFVLQSSTAGMDLLLPQVLEALQEFVSTEAALSWGQTAIILSNDSKSRLLENVAVEEKRVSKTVADIDWNKALVRIQPALPEMPALIFDVDFLGGQKTGFFLDQRLNIHLAGGLFKNLLQEKRPLRVLDLCCYIGQWGTQFAHLAQQTGLSVEITSVDASHKALEFAQRNVLRHGGESKIEKLDVMTDLERLERGAYDVVICDPPAFIKKKKDLPTGQAAYYKLNREALKRLKPGGLFISCSCSGLLEEGEFRQVLARAVSTSAHEMRWLMRGSHSPDHPQKAEFPQGTYLKSWMGFSGSLI